MSNVLKVALPGYNALTDTNPDHFALYVDGSTDHILIKEKQRGSGSVNDSSTATITHNLGYIPYVLVFYEQASGKWRNVRGDDSFNSSNFYIIVTTTTLTINNFSGATKNYKYYIFYDVITGTSANTITESAQVVKIAKIGKNALTTKDPNDFIFHSDLNSFKIIAQGTFSDTLAAFTYNQLYLLNHDQSFIPLVYGFVKFADYSHILPPNGEDYTVLGFSDYAVRFNYIEADVDNIRISMSNNDSSPHSFTLKYYIFEVPL